MSGLGGLGAQGGRSIRVRLLLLALLPLGIVLPVLLAVLAIWGGDYLDRLQIAKVRADLAIAHGYYERVAEGVGRSVEGLAGSALDGNHIGEGFYLRRGFVFDGEERTLISLGQPCQQRQMSRLL